jgi:tetratricopeptide (TPR) repeat protein
MNEPVADELDVSRRPTAPALPDGIDPLELDREVQQELMALPGGLAELIGKHLVAAAQIVDEDPRRALEHARFVRTRAARVPVVREAAGVVAYRAGEWAEALSELRAARRLGGGPGLLAMMADCERALGRPERALELARSAQARELAPEDAVELRIVAAGARRDLGQPDAAVIALQGPDLDIRRRDPWSARLFYAYADSLVATGRFDEAARWFVAAADADEDGETDAAERAAELSGGRL